MSKSKEIAEFVDTYFPERTGAPFLRAAIANAKGELPPLQRKRFDTIKAALASRCPRRRFRLLKEAEGLDDLLQIGEQIDRERRT